MEQENQINATLLVSTYFKWSEKRNGFAIESHEAIKAFNTAELQALKRLEEEGKLSSVGAFGYVVNRSYETLFFSKTDIEAVRPVAKENRDFAAYAFMLEFASRKLGEEAVGLLFEGDVWVAISYVRAVAEENEGVLEEICLKLPKLRNDQGTKFSLPCIGFGYGASLNFIAEVVGGQFRMWISWTIYDEAKTVSGDVVRHLVGQAIAKNCIDQMKFIASS